MSGASNTNQSSNQATKRLINQSTDQLINYTLHLADNTLILCQRNAEWTGHGPILEQDIAISNIALDLVGQSRYLYQYAAQLISQLTSQLINQSTDEPITEDTLAYMRNAADFKNCLLAELPRGDWGFTVLRQFFFSNYQFYLYQQLQQSKDDTLAAIAVKSLKEVTYHLKWSAEWVIRLGDGTLTSHQRMQDALQKLSPFTEELLVNASYETALATEGIAIDLATIKESWINKTKEVLAIATLSIPEKSIVHSGGKEGKHSEYLESLLAEMQYLQRTYPNNNW
ncbi:MAG: phenylacetate-CoA oxygenase subunit PaaC [Chitinophagaceae bacterium]